MKKSAGRSYKGKHLRAELTLPVSLDRFLTEFGARARTTGGYQLPKTEIIRALIRVLMKLKVDVSGVKDEDELVARIMKKVKK